MATIHQYVNNSTDKMLFFLAREALQRKFDVGSWTELRLGIFYAANSTSSYTSSISGENLTINSEQDALTFGLKDSATQILPKASGSYFMGLSTNTGGGTVNLNSNKFEHGTGTNFYSMAYYGTSSYGSSQNLSAMTFSSFANGQNDVSNYNGCYVLKLVLNNSGSASQTVTMSSYNANNTGGTNYSANNLLNYMTTTAAFGSTATVTWNNSSSAYPIPDSFWIRVPHRNNALRLSAIGLVKIS